jgi:hypothetical protein
VKATRAVVMTMVRDEAFMLPRWVDYYGAQLGLESLLVLDDSSVDGSTQDLPCTTYRVPAPPWKKGWAKTRAQLVNGLARGLLACNDVVIFTDVDEFLVPDPAVYAGLPDYLADRSDRRVVAPVALEVMHNARLEPALDPARPVLEQRAFVKFSPGMCKPLVKRTPRPWLPAFHAIQAPFEIDPALWMLHLKYADEDVLGTIAEQRRTVHEAEGRGHPRSFWPMGAEKLKGRLSAWTGSADATAEVPELDVAELDLAGLVGRTNDGSWKSRGNQVRSLEESPLRRLPERFRAAF